jgi:Type IX secretion system protein PorV
MRRLLFSVATFAILSASAGAQSSSTGGESTLFLLLPTGAQSVGMGEAMVAAKPGSEGIWWNPASLAGQEKKELAIHHSNTLSGVSDAFSFVIPKRSLGVVALSLSILDIGELQLTDSNNQPIGVAFPRDVVLAGTYANRITKRLDAGLSYKIVQLREDCSGECATIGPEVESTRAMDLGAQFRTNLFAPLTFGAAIRNLGGKLNSQETNQRDPLPTQVELGAMYRLKFLDRYVKDTELRASGSYVDTRSFGGKSVRFGTDLAYQGTVHLRAGYVGHDRRGDSSASLGFGLQSGSLAFDIARTFGGIPAENGDSPVWVSLRYLF